MRHAAQVATKDATEKAASELQAVLVDLVDLGLQGKQAHWNVVGPLFRAVHLELDELVDDAHKWADEVAERIRALGVAADGRPGVILRESGIPSVPEGLIGDCDVLSRVGDELTAVVARCQAAIEHLDGRDKASEDILIGVIKGAEKHLWMFRSQHA
ncbi:MAG TPA: DNA starvation/stationary phase protection protein [Candidatus Acidoferrum sp.]|nr:DNA starvation/stationary phase protection protein [Candidatus Acidoferrum sp.]